MAVGMSTSTAKAPSSRSTTSCGVRDCAGSEAAKIDEHDGDAAEVAGRTRLLRHQPLHNLRRDVLAEQVRHPVARGGRRDARCKLPPQPRADGAREHAADQG